MSASRKDASSFGKKGGYAALNINYKGGRADGAKHHGGGRGGLQSLGKVSSRRMPAPVALPSLRSENAGNDPNVSLVPSGGSGWKHSKEESQSGDLGKENRRDEEEETRLSHKPKREVRGGGDRAGGDRFHSEFPSLEEQESMSKRELEDMQERRAREDNRERSPSDRPAPERGWGEHHPHRPHGNVPPFLPGPYPPPHYGMYMMHPMRHGTPPYGSGPLPPGGRGGPYPPPPHQMGYGRPPFPPYPQPNPFDVDPYKMPPRNSRGREGVEVSSRPPTVKADDLRSMELLDEDDSGWAGHHEEVDYSKEVVFSDSDEDEDLSKKEGKKVAEKAKKSGDGGGPLTSGQGDNKPPTTTHSSVADPSSGDWRAPARAPHGRPPSGGQRSDSPSEKKPSSQPHPYSVYPPYPYYNDAYGRYPVYPVPHGIPPYGYPPPPPGPRYGGHTDRGGKRRHSDREREREDNRRHDFHPWDHNTEHVPKRKWTEEGDRPKILTKDKDWRETQPLQEAGEKSLAPSVKRSSSTSSDPPGTDSTHHVSFLPSQETEPESSSHPMPTMRSQPKKIMLRKMGDNSKADVAESQEKTEAGKMADRLNDVKSPLAGQAGLEQDSSETASDNPTAKPRSTVWKVTDRAASSSAKTLYEPEGKKSEAKFRKYQHDARERGGSKREKTGQSPATTPSEIQAPAHIPDVGEREKTNDKVPLKRTVSSDRGREGDGRKGKGGGNRHEEREEERHQWNEPRKSHSDHQRDHGSQRDHHGARRDHSGPQREPHDHQRDHTKHQGDHPEQQRSYQESWHHSSGRPPYERRDSDRQEWRAPGRRERGRGDRRSRGSETDDLKDSSKEPQTKQTHTTAQPRGLQPSSETGESVNNWQQVQRDGVEEGGGQGEEDPPPVSQLRKPGKVQRERGKGGSDHHPGRTQRLPSKGEDSRPKDDQKPSGRPAEEKKGTQSSVASPIITTAPASVPQTVINKSFTVQMSDCPPASLLAPFPAHSANRPRPPLLEDPPHSLRKEMLPPRAERRPRDTGDRRNRQDRQREGSRGEGNRVRQGSQRARGDHDRDKTGGRQENKTSKSAVNVEVEQVGDRDKPGGRGRGDRRGRERGGRGRGRGPARHVSVTSEDSKPPPVPPEEPPAEQGRRESGRGRERRRRDSRRERGNRMPDSSYSQAEASQKPPREARDSGRGTTTDQRGGRKEKGWTRGRPSRPSSTPAKKGDEVKLDTGYGDTVEDIESGSDWEGLLEDRANQRKSEGGGASGVTEPSVSVCDTQSGGLSKSRGRGQRRDEQRDHSEPLRSEQQVSTGRGRGRGVERGRGRMGRPVSSKRRPGDKGEGPPEVKPDPNPANTSHGDKGDGKSAQQSVDHKQQEFAKYDLNSTTIAIVDDIEGQLQGEEVESTNEFVEVTSKKAQKEKVKKEREEQWRQANESKEEHKRSRKPDTVKRSEQTTSQLALKPSTAWGSKGELEEGPQANIWGTSTAPSSEWNIMLGAVASSAAPGAQFKELSSWPVSVGTSVGVGVIGEGLQARPATATLASQAEHLTTATGYSLFPVKQRTLGPLLTAGPYGGSGGMLSAAVDLKLSQEHLPPSSEPAPSGSSTHMGTVEDFVKEGAQVGQGKESKEPEKSLSVRKPNSSEPSAEDSYTQPGTRSRTDEGRPVTHSGHGKSSLPPRLQSNRTGGGVGRGRGGPRGRRGERGKRGAEGEQREHDVPGEGKAEAQPRARDREKAESGRFYVPPPSRGEGRKGSRSGANRQGQQQQLKTAKQSNSSGTAAEAGKVPASSIKVAVGVASDTHVTGHMIPELPDAEGAERWSCQQQLLRAGSGSQVGGESQADHDVAEGFLKKGVGGGSPGERVCVAEASDECGTSGPLKPKAAAKTFSYAQALKTSLADSGWSSPRSHTPSEGSLPLDTRTPTPVSMLMPIQTPSQTPPLSSNTVGNSPSHVELATTPEYTHHSISPDKPRRSPDKPYRSSDTPASPPESSAGKVQPLQHKDVMVGHSAVLDSAVSPRSDGRGSPQDEVVVHQPLLQEPLIVREEGSEVAAAEVEKVANQLTPAKNTLVEDVGGRELPQVPSPPTLQSRVQPILNNAPMSSAQGSVPDAPPTSLPAFPHSHVQLQPDHLLQAHVPIPVPSQEQSQTQLPQKQWPRQAQVPTQQLLTNQRQFEQPLQGGPQPLLQNQQNRQGSIQLTHQHLQQQHTPQSVQLQHMQLKQQQQQQLHFLHIQQMAAQKQHQLQLLQHVHRLQRHGYLDPAPLVSVARLPTPQQPLHLLTSRPQVAAPAPQVLPTASHLNPQNVMLMRANLQQAFQQQLMPKHLQSPSRHPVQQNSEQSKLLRSDRPTSSPPGLLKTHYVGPAVASQPAVTGAGSSYTLAGDHSSREMSQPASGQTGVTVAVCGDKLDGNGDMKSRLSVTASPFIPGGKSEQPVAPPRPPKKISPPLVESLPPSSRPRHPPGFEHPQVARQFLLQSAVQPAVLPNQPLPLTAVRPLTTLPATPLANHPALLPPAQLAALRMQQSLAKTASLPLHLPAHTTRQTGIQTRPVSFYQYHQPSRGDALLRHDPTHHTKATPSPSDSSQILDQPKILQLPSVPPQGSGGLIPNPFAAAGVTFVPPVTVPALPLTTPTPTPSPQTLSLTKSGSALRQPKKALLPTPTTLPTAPRTALAPSSTTAVPVRLPLAHRQEQQLQHSY